MLEKLTMFVCLAILLSVSAGQAGTPTPSTEGQPTPPSRFRRVPVYATVEGQPIDSRPPEKSDDKPLFPEQTRAPFHATAPFTVTTLAGTLYAWALAFLPDGKILITEKLPGAIRILNQQGDAKQGVLSNPLAGLSAVSSVPEFGVLDLAVDPHFATNRRIFFTFFEWVDNNDSHTYVTRAKPNEAETALTDVQVIFRTTPAIPAHDSLSAATKTGGRLAIGSDGNLFVLIGGHDNAGSTPWDVSDLQNVSIASDHLVQHRVDEEAKEKARDQAGDDHNGKRPLRVRTDAGGKSRRQQPETGDQGGHHDRPQPQERSLPGRGTDVAILQTQLVDIGDEDNRGFHRNTHEREQAQRR